MSERRTHLARFYSLLDRLEQTLAGARTLAQWLRALGLAKQRRLFRESGEGRTDTGKGQRVVRVGTHALKAGSGTKLWTRLSQHKGQPGTGSGKSPLLRSVQIGTSLRLSPGVQTAKSTTRRMFLCGKGSAFLPRRPISTRDGLHKKGNESWLCLQLMLLVSQNAVRSIRSRPMQI
jgi:hypothetical protein